MKKRQLAKLCVTLGLVAAVGVGGTIALLSAQSNPVRNTFAAGNGINAAEDLTLFEHNTMTPNAPDLTDKFRDGTATGEKIGKIDLDGVAYENLEPDMKIKKDPTVQVSAQTANCYLFVKVTNGLTEGEKKINNVTINGIYSEEGNPNWKLVPETTDLYYYTATGEPGYVVNTKRGQVITEPLFTEVSLGSKAALYDTNGNNKLDESNNIEIKALAVQATNNGGKGNWQDALNTARTFNWNNDVQ